MTGHLPILRWPEELDHDTGFTFQFDTPSLRQAHACSSASSAIREDADPPARRAHRGGGRPKLRSQGAIVPAEDTVWAQGRYTILSHHRVDQLSSYALIGRFYDLNALPYNTFMALPFWRHDKDKDLADWQSFDLRLLSEMYLTSRDRLMGAFVHPTYDLFHVDTRRLRFCTACARLGWHFTAFQVNRMARCPVHHHPLWNACPDCGFPLGYSVRSWLKAGPFSCTNCQRNFGPNGPSPNAGRRPFSKWTKVRVSRATLGDRSAFATLIPVRDWASLGWRPVVTGSAQPVRGAGLARTFAEICLDAESSHAAKLPDNPVMKKVLARSAFVPNAPRRLATDLAFRREPQQRDDVVCSLNRCYRTIRRHVEKTLLRGHDGCARRLVAQAGGRGSDMATSSNDCPRAEAYARWRMRWEGVGTPGHLLRRAVHVWLGIVTWYALHAPLTPPTWTDEAERWLILNTFCTACLLSFHQLLDYAGKRGRTGVPWASVVLPSHLWLAFGTGDMEDELRLYVEDLRDGMQQSAYAQTCHDPCAFLNSVTARKPFGNSKNLEYSDFYFRR